MDGSLLKDDKARTPEEIAKKKAEDEEAKWDMIYMGIAVLLVLFVISAFMVGSAHTQSHVFILTPFVGICSLVGGCKI
jgi:hypothetical protein